MASSVLLEQLESEEQTVQVTHTRFTVEEFILFARELRDIETVTQVFLRSNQLTDDMIIPLAEALSHNKSVKELYLSENLIGDRGAEALAQALKRNKTLEILHLNENRITDSGAEQLMHALELNTTLKCLFLLRNSISIDTSLEHKLPLRQDYARLLALCTLSVPRLAKNSQVYPLPNDVLHVIRSMLSDSWSDGFPGRARERTEA